MSNAYIEGHVKTSKPGRRYSRANGRRTANLSIHNYVYNSIPADWPVAAGDCVEWIDAHGEILQGTVRGAKNINGVPHVTVKMAGGKVKPAALDAVKVASPAIEVDPEFKALIPALTTEEYSALEESLLSEGCRDALVVWAGHNVLVDGHNRYELCTRHNLPYKTVEREFDSRESAMLWMIANQGSRRNLTSYQRGMLADKRQIILDRITPKSKPGPKPDNYFPNSENNSPTNTWQQASQDFGVAKDTISKVRTVESKAPESVKQAARSGEISTNKAYELTKALEKLPAEYRDHAAENTDSPERVGIWLRLYKSMGSPETNGTFEEIHRTGGFQYGKDMDKWCAFWTDPIETIHKALQSVADHHKRVAVDIKNNQRIETAAALPELDDYRLGDCLKVLPTLAPKSVRLVLTDPPYGMDFQSNRRTATAQAPKIEGDFNIDEAIALLRQTLKAVDHAMMDECHLLIFTGWRYEPQFRTVIENAGYQVAASIIWVKENHTSGDLAGFAPRHERILHARRGRLPVSPRVDDVLMVSREGSTNHPTEKPTALLRTLIECTTVPGELVVDPFAGTGSTVVSARQTGRKAIGIELSDVWFAEGKLRLQEAVNEPA